MDVDPDVWASLPDPIAVLVVPALACAAAAVLGRLVGLRSAAAGARSATARDTLVALGVAVAIAGSVEALGARPRLPPAAHENAWTWVFWIAPLGLLAGLLETRARAPLAAAFALRAIVAAACAWVVLVPVVPARFGVVSAVARALGAGVLGAATWTAIDLRARREGGGAPAAWPFAVSAFAASLAMAAIALSPRLAGVTGAIGLSALATAALAPLRGGAALPSASAPVLALTFVAMLVAGNVYLEDLSLPAAVCFALAPLAVLVPRRTLAALFAAGAVVLGLLLARG